MQRFNDRLCIVFGLLVVLLIATGWGWAQTSSSTQKPTTTKTTTTATKPKPEFPPYSQILEGYEKVVSTADGQQSFYTIWIRKKDGQMLAELPRGYTSQKHFIAMTIASGDRFAGLQAGDMYVYWRRYDKRLALIEPNVGIRSTGDPESKNSVKRLFTDRVVLDVPILTLGPSGSPVIDMDALLVGQAIRFFGPSARIANRNLISIKKAKAFPQNVELAFEVPVGQPSSIRSYLPSSSSSGTLQTLHYSISLIPTNSKYKPRKADERVGYFTTSYSDLGKYSDEETRVRYINRWYLEKRDPKLKVSPPVKPITFYIEHTTPVRYRRWVRQGILYWNKAFERIGLSDAIEVVYQDATTKAHMDLDPEDARWNFVRWLNNDVGTAIGPSRVNPMTGEILDADIILTDGWIRHYRQQFEDVMPRIATQGFNAETLAWLAQHPTWDPRIRMAHPSQRAFLAERIAAKARKPYAGYPVMDANRQLIGNQPYDGLIGRTSQINGLCLAAQGMAFDVALMRMVQTILADEPKAGDKTKDDEKKKEDDKDKKKDKDKDKDKDKKTLIDGMPESFIGPLLAELVVHEVGHTLGLRHNFKGSSIHSLAEINSAALKGKTTLAGSVMDYLPVNFNVKSGDIQGDYTVLGIGPYDYWAIEYGYSFAKDLKPILQRVAEPELQYATDEDTGGPDPLARRYDFSSNPLDYAKNQIRLAELQRGRILDKLVKDGQSWSKARRAYELTLSLQFRAVSMMANWVGGAFVHRDKKGDKNGRAPIEVVSAKAQRDALAFVIDKTFEDQAYGLTAKLLSHMTVDKWLDGDDWQLSFADEPTWPVHDRIMGLQASTLTMLMKPTTLRRVYDNEFHVPSDQDALTLAELLDALSTAIWREVKNAPDKIYTARSPMISSLRRNLQQEHLDRLITLSMPGAGSTEAYKPIANLALLEIRRIRSLIGAILTQNGDKVDPYTSAHLIRMQDQIGKALDAEQIYNVNAISSRSGSVFILGSETDVERIPD